jgi:hypothetical protein
MLLLLLLLLLARRDGTRWKLKIVRISMLPGSRRKILVNSIGCRVILFGVRDAMVLENQVIELVIRYDRSSRMVRLRSCRCPGLEDVRDFVTYQRGRSRGAFDSIAVFVSGGSFGQTFKMSFIHAIAETSSFRFYFMMCESYHCM